MSRSYVHQPLRMDALARLFEFFGVENELHQEVGYTVETMLRTIYEIEEIVINKINRG
jgi:hypothetical protein